MPLLRDVNVDVNISMRSPSSRGSGTPTKSPEMSRSGDSESGPSLEWTDRHTNLESVDEALLRLLPRSSYDALLDHAKQYALSSYRDSFGSSLDGLLVNHQKVESVLNTEGDQSDVIEVNTDNISDEELARIIRLMEKKLERVTSDIDDLSRGNRKKEDKLEQILAMAHQ